MSELRYICPHPIRLKAWLLPSSSNRLSSRFATNGTVFSPPASSPWAPMPRHMTSAYDHFMQEPYRAADCFASLKSNGSNFAEWLTCLDRVISVAFNTEMSVDDSPSSLKNRSPEENRAIFHFIDAAIPHKFALCVGITPLQSTEKAFFVAIKARCSPGNRFEKLRLVRSMLTMLIENGSGTPCPNNVIILSLRCTFVLLKKLGVEADELEGLLAQAACHAPATLDHTAFNQLVTTAILAEGDEKPTSTFVGKIILNASTKCDKDNCQVSPFVYRIADPPATPMYQQRPCSLGPTQPWCQATEVRCPPDHLVDKFGAACFHCGRAGHWCANCPITKGVANPNPRPPRPKTPEERPPSASGSCYQQERVSQVQFVEHHAADKVLIDSGASIDLSGSKNFATDLCTIHPFCIFFADSNSSITITKIVTLKIPVEGGVVVVSNVPFSDKVSGTILSVGRLCKVGVFPLFSGLVLSLVVCDRLITTTFHNKCWWMNVKLWEGTIELAAETPSPPLFGMNLLSFPSTSKLSCQEWHASDRVVRSFLKQHVPSFDMGTWQSFYCEVCAKSKSTHWLARARFDITRDKPLDLLASKIMGPLDQDPQGFRYLLIIRDHISTFSIVYPLKVRSDTPAAVLDAIAHLTVQLETRPNNLASAFIHHCLFTPRRRRGRAPQPDSGGYGKGNVNRERAQIPRRTRYCMDGLLLSLPCTHSGRGPSSMCRGSNSNTNWMQGALSADFSSHYWPPVAGYSGIRQVLTKVLFEREERVIDSLPLAKDISIPENLKQALAGLDRHRWEQACLEELQQMKRHSVWHAIEKMPTMKTIGHCWVFETKIDESGNIEKFKARLGARGDQQQPGIDSMEGMFFRGERSLPLQPSRGNRLDGTTHPFHAVPHLRKALYGMKQVGRCWWLHLLGILETLGFTSCEVDMSRYVFRNDETIIAIWIHVDDGVIASNSPTAIERFRETLFSTFEIKWSENMKPIVGLECIFGEGEVTISQNRLTNEILDAYPRKILQRNSPLPPIQTPALHVDGLVMDAMPFRLVIGSLAYLVSGSQPDLAFTVNYLARHLMAPTATHWDVLDHLVGYLLETRGHGTILRPGECALNLWGGELEQSQSGFMLKLGNAPILWGSKRQTVVALLTCAAEYIALSNLTQHLVQAINQLAQLAQDFKKTIFCDNQVAVQVSIDNLSCKRMRYLDRAFFFVNDVIRKHGIMVKWVNT
ncbi:hypothetical protein O181_016564 [Austropuccinia psidii MF-1]|uniref:CCHC-type domain-containing protein n=1 Tax=Austropuccinia psidii MF-1 TaxID=1389203 RepID=A0A9Q3C1Y2_9BASI|nr:hypothetical protein [Austropuccinia psidii MF-1]